MTRRKPPTFIPGEEYQAAYGRAIETAHICAAALFGEQPVEEPAKQASPRALIMAKGMMYFLARLDPKDLAALASDGGLAEFWKPFPPDFAAAGKGPFNGFLTMP